MKRTRPAASGNGRNSDMLARVAVAFVLLGVIALPRTWAWFGMGDLHSEYRDVMNNCRMDGGSCFDPYAEARAGGEQEEGVPRRRPAARGGAKGRNQRGRGRAPPPAPPPRVNPWAVLQENCGSWEFDFGCQRTGGFCCYPYP